MEKEINANNLKVDSMELLNKFILSCKERAQTSESRSALLSYADIVTAVYYYRMFPDVEEFIQKYLKGCADYFLIQWVRNTWASFEKMSPEEICNLVINQITLVTSSDE